MKAQLVVIFVILAGCKSHDSFPDTSTFELANVWVALSDVTPANPVDYIELRRSLGEMQSGMEDFSVVDSTGVKCTDSTCQSALAHLPAQNNGFNQGCLPARCFYYLVSTSGQEVHLWSSTEELKQLFGEIDTRGEAILLAFASGYSFNSIDHQVSGIKKIPDGYQVVCTKMVSFCTPILTNLYVLQVSKNGEVKILNEKEYQREDKMCI